MVSILTTTKDFLNYWPKLTYSRDNSVGNYLITMSTIFTDIKAAIYGTMVKVKESRENEDIEMFCIYVHNIRYF